VKLSRRTSVRLLAGAAAIAPAVLAQAPAIPPARAAPKGPAADTNVQAARDELKSATQRIAAVKLPSTVEPAFRFRA
jgi:hypothetical protein